MGASRSSEPRSISCTATAAKNVLPVLPARKRSSTFSGVPAARSDTPVTTPNAVPSGRTTPTDAPGNDADARHSSR